MFLKLLHPCSPEGKERSPWEQYKAQSQAKDITQSFIKQKKTKWLPVIKETQTGPVVSEPLLEQTS